MKAILCTAYGPPEKLELADLEAPRAAAGEVVVAVNACALNFFDNLIIAGKYQYRPDPPFSPGAEVAGVVTATGAGVRDFAAGDRVVGYLGWGGCRQQVAAPAERFVALPDGLDDNLAAGLTVTYGTTVHALQDRARLRSGETLAVLGAAGGVGQAAIEIGKIMGARVIACASSDDKLEFCKGLGADDTFNYATGDLKEGLRRLTGGKGVDVVYDAVGGDLSEPALRAMAWQGRFLVIGFAAGSIAKIPLNLVLLKGCEVVGVFWGEHISRQPQAHRANMAQLLAWAAEGRIRPHVHKVYALAETAEALAAIARREVKGKAIVAP
jgi:NADPH2:quinone reductase